MLGERGKKEGGRGTMNVETKPKRGKQRTREMKEKEKKQIIQGNIKKVRGNKYTKKGNLAKE
jgi:hypothetical protein